MASFNLFYNIKPETWILHLTDGQSGVLWSDFLPLNDGYMHLCLENGHVSNLVQPRHGKRTPPANQYTPIQSVCMY